MTLRETVAKWFNLITRESYDQVTDLLIQYQDEENARITVGHEEHHITSKYPTVKKLYAGRPLPPKNQKVMIDPRILFTPYDSKLWDIVKKLDLTGMSDDDKVFACFKWVRKNIKYVLDKNNFGSSEYWSFPYETLAKRAGDCDSQSILLANLCLVAGVPYHKIRLTCGPVKGGYHAFLTYYVTEHEHWTIMDTCYWPSYEKVKDRASYKYEDNYFDQIWFSWDQENVYQKSHKTWIK